jgi:hypothetical protein
MVAFCVTVDKRDTVIYFFNGGSIADSSFIIPGCISASNDVCLCVSVRVSVHTHA